MGRRSMFVGLAWVRVFLVLVLGMACVRAEFADYGVDLQSPHDAVTFALKGGALTVQVKSATGIGRVELTVKEKAAWPETVVLEIATRDGKPLKELEGFSLSGKAIRINGSRRSSGRMDAYDVDPNNPKKPKNRRQVKVEVKKTGKAMVVTIPGKLLAGERKLRIQWIDYYR